MKEVLFVCTGNLCRSTIAQGYLTFLLEKHGIQGWRALSAGTHAQAGTKPPEEACFVCQENGFDIREHEAVLLTREQVLNADFIFVMERYHRDMVLILSPLAKEKVFPLTHFLSGKGRGRDIPDPFMKPYRNYVEALKTIESCLQGFLATIANPPKPQNF